MFRVIEIVGLCAPLVGMVLVLYYRRRIGGAFLIAIAAGALALTASVVGMATSRAMYFGGGGDEGILHRMDVGVGVRSLFLVAAWVLLLVAIHRRPRAEQDQR